ncbi:MAG: endolytic transglycosylase MltG [Acidobacteriota bacterium]
MRRVLLALVMLALLVVGAAAGAAWWLNDRLETPYRGWPGDEVLLSIEPGTSATAILQRLERAGVIENARLARLHLVYRAGDPPLHAGDYRFDRAATAPEVLERLVEGDVVTYLVTLIEGLTLEESAQAIAAADFSTLEALLAEMRDPSRIADLDPEAETLEGYLYPETYRFRRDAPASLIVDRLVETFRERFARDVAPLLAGVAWADVDVAGRGPDATPRALEASSAPAGDRLPGEVSAQEAGLDGRSTIGPVTSLRELVVLASIVERETQLDAERGQVASVYVNRLERSIGLYADPTIVYALKRSGRWDGNIRKADLQMDDPYNTYVYGGLPPGPICSPTAASLAAVAAPDDTNYLYFVSRNDGTHVFAETLAEHNRNVYTWQKLYWRERRRAAADG